MPRQARLDAPGTLHHVIIRGIERRKIFRDEKDYQNLLERLGALLPETKMTCYAWTLMTNHAHFLLRSGGSGLATFMRKLLTGYAVSFNHRHKRHGQLFQNRYKSILCQEDPYFMELVRYIHLNPLRGKLVSDLKELEPYPYSGHSTLMGKMRRDWQETDYVLGYFGKTLAHARKNYFEYMREGLSQGRRPELTGGGLIRSLGGWKEVKKKRQQGSYRIKGDERILGETDFVLDILTQAEERLERGLELKKMGYDLSRTVERVSEICGVDSSVIMSQGKRKEQVKARDLFCYFGVKKLGYSITEMARHLGLTPSTIGYAVQRGEKLAKEKGYTLEK